MQLPFIAAILLSISVQAQAKEGLDILAKKAGLDYLGSATDSPGQREREGLEDSYAEYDKIMWKSDEFGSTTPTNGQKWFFSEPKLGVFNYTEGEIVTSKAKEAGKLLRCHALIWHDQLAEWVEETTWTEETLTAVVIRHITNLVGHWKGECYSWDVVNEPLNEDGSYRESLFYEVLGEEYIRHAFQTAADADPGAKLYLNEYNIELPGPKVEGAKRIIRMLQEDGVKIDSVGIQAHLLADGVSYIDGYIEVMRGFGHMGIHVAITELDVSIEAPTNATNLAKQKMTYKNIVGACVQVEECIGITIWDFYDPFSWIPYEFPGQGAASLWFGDFATHPAYDGVVEAFNNETERTGSTDSVDSGGSRSMGLLRE